MEERLFSGAKALGFDFISVGEIVPCARWRREAERSPDSRWSQLEYDPRALLPEARRVILLLKHYAPYRQSADEVRLSSYYLCSNEAFCAARAVAELLREAGFRALQTERFPYKATAALLGLGTYLRNGLIARAPFGSRFVLQMILTDAKLKADAELTPQTELFTGCGVCGLCERTCPTGALGDGRIDTERCLRALPGGAAIPEAFRPLIGGNLLGCELCQNACPQNRLIASVKMPEALRAALELPGLLRGEVAPLSRFIGKNYARKKQTQARACLIAANLQRTDCRPLVQALCEDDFPAVREHARWAVDRLGKA